MNISGITTHLLFKKIYFYNIISTQLLIAVPRKVHKLDKQDSFLEVCRTPNLENQKFKVTFQA